MPKRGIFVKNSHYLKNRADIEKIVEFCKATHIDTIFLRLYNNDQCWFSTENFNSSFFERIKEEYNEDLLKYLLTLAKKENIDVFSWIITFGFHRYYLDHNLLIKKYGKSVLTKDQYGNYYDGERTGESREKYYQRDTLCWLEPGDLRVVSYLKGIIEELTDNYPQLKGVLFDFIRYPSDVPFIPGARYIGWSYSAGFGDMSVERFVERHGFHPTAENVSMKHDRSRESQLRALAWDRWRREQISTFLREVSQIIRSKGMSVSCAVFAFADRLYLHGFQNWRGWIEEDVVDFLVLMNYSLDDEMVYQISKQHITTYSEKIWIGLGAYLFRGNAQGFERQLTPLFSLRPSGIVFFEYDSIRDHPNVILIKE